MCGISGHISFNIPPEPELIRKMVDDIHHRGPDDSGLWKSVDSDCVLGHARLSVIDLSPLGHQPMLDAETGNCIVFNGEIYNFQELRSECEKNGFDFRSHSDTEVILALYRTHGVKCLEKLRGMFAFALWDQRCRQLFMARDRAGKKPFNYSLQNKGILFCSEIDPLVQHPQVATDMDSEALELYLQCQYIPAPWTIYQNIRKLPPAHYAIFDQNGFTIQKYWEVDYRHKVRINQQEALEELEEHLTEAVRLRMISDVPLGALLSGGVDSSIVVALMAKLSKEPIRTFSIGFKENSYNELPYALQAAQRCKTKHHPEIISGDVATLLPQLIRFYGEPFADSSAVPSFFVSETARRHVTVVMNGDGGDELLGGYHRYKLPRRKLFSAALCPDLIPPNQLAGIASRLASATSIPARAARKTITEYCWPELRSVNMYSGFWDDNIRKKLIGRNDNNNLLPDWRGKWLEDAMDHGENPVDRMLWYDNHTYLPGDLLVKMDIASMHCGLETRSPLLDHKLIEYCAALPVSCKVNGGIGKYLLKKLTEKYFPVEFVHRQKMGFAIPVTDWLRGPLRPLLEDTLLNKDIMDPLDMTVITGTLGEFLASKDGGWHSFRLWALLMYGLWHQHAKSGGS